MKKKKKLIKKKSTGVLYNNFAPIGTLANVNHQFGLSMNNTKQVESIKNLRNNTPNVIIAKCLKMCKFKQNKFVIQTLERKNNYVMTTSMYRALEFDTYSTSTNPSKNLESSKTSFKQIYRSYNGQDLTNKRLLIIRTGGIGDLLFILPNLIYLKEKYPTCKIVFATSPQYHSMLKEWNCVDKVIAMPFSDIEAKISQYHLIFEGVIERTEEAKKINAYKLFSKWMGLNLPDNKLRPIQKANIDVKKEVIDILHNKLNIPQDQKICVLQLKASSPIRTPHPKNFWEPVIRLILTRGFKIVITDNPLIHNQIENIINKYFSFIKDNIYNFTKYSKTISYSIALAEIADVVVGTDSSMIHIAESVGTKNFGFYGPFPGAIRVGNYIHGAWIDGNCECSPCFTHGHLPCIHGGANGGCSPCYNTINLLEFKEKFISLVES